MSQKNKLSLSVQFADKTLAEQLPRASIRRWVQAALFAPAELTIRFVDQAEGQTLNSEYRGKDYATNVLTFAYTEDEPDADSEAATQADIVLCSDVLVREANDLSISVQQHAAHLVVHGVLHAQGYDHEIDADAQEMEKLETDILQQLGWPDPYAAT